MNVCRFSVDFDKLGEHEAPEKRSQQQPSSEDKPNQKSTGYCFLSCSDPPNSAPSSSSWAMTAPLLRQLLGVVKALILASRRLAKETWIRLVRKAALLWRVLRTTLRIGRTKKRYDPKKPGTTTHDYSTLR